MPGISESSKGHSSVDLDHLQENWVIIPPDGGWGWVVVFASFVINFFIDGLTYCFGLFLEDISNDLKVHPTRVALATSLMTGFYYFAGPLSCGLTNRYGFRFVSILGAVITASSFTGASFLHNLIPFLVLVGFIAGIGLNMIYTPCLLIVGFYFEKWRALTTAISVTGTSIGIMAFPQIVNTLLENFTWRVKFQIFSGIFLGLIALMLTFKPVKPTRILQTRKVAFADDVTVQDIDIDDVGEATGWGVLWNIITRYRASNARPDTRSGFVVLDENEDTYSYVPSAFGAVSARVQSFTSYGGLSTVSGYRNVEEQTNKNCCQKFLDCCRTKPEKQRPMYREDILYGGSVYRLNQYQEASPMYVGTKKRRVSYHVSVTRAISETELVQIQKKCVVCHDAVLRVLVSMLDYRLLKSPSFILLIASGFFTSLGIYTPYTFMVERIKETGLDRDKGSFLISIAGFSSTIGRVLCGILSCLPKIDVIVFSYVTLFLASAATIVSCFIDKWIVQVTYAVLFGLNTSSFNVLRTIVIADMLGLENLTNGFGINIMFYGIASFIGIPIASEFQQLTGKYAHAILFAGSSIMLSSILLMPIRSVKNWENNKNKNRK